MSWRASAGDAGQLRSARQPCSVLLGAIGWGGAAAVVAFLVARNEAYGLADEGFRFLLSRSWARGEDLFSRFRLLYLPGEYLWFGAWLRVFGESVIVLRMASAVVLGGAATVLYATVRPWGGLGSSRHRFFAWLPAAALAVTVGLAVQPVPKALAMAIVIAMAMRVFAQAPPTSRWVCAASVGAGLLAGVREDSAVLAAAAAVALALRRRPLALATHVAPCLFAGFAPWWVLFAARGELLPFLAHARERYAFLVGRFGEPTSVLSGPISPLPADLQALKARLLWGAVILPPALYLGLLGRQLWRRLRGRTVYGRLVGVALVGIAYLPQFLWERADLRHFRAHLPILLVAIVALTTTGQRGSRVRIAGVAAVLLFGAGSLGWLVMRRHHERVVAYPTPVARAMGASVLGTAPPWAPLEARPGDTLIVLTWGPGWYTVEDVPPGSRHLSTFLRHTDRPDIIAELRRDLGRATNRWVLVRLQREVPAGVLAFVRACYAPAGMWWDWQLWERRLPGDGKTRGLDCSSR